MYRRFSNKMIRRIEIWTTNLKFHMNAIATQKIFVRLQCDEDAHHQSIKIDFKIF